MRNIEVHHDGVNFIVGVDEELKQAFARAAREHEWTGRSWWGSAATPQKYYLDFTQSIRGNRHAAGVRLYGRVAT